MALIVVFLIGLCVGSFLNVLADRLPRGESVLWGRSHCDFCKKPLRWYELIPVISFLIQGGRCRRCHKPLSVQYPLVELVTVLGFVLLYLHFNDSIIRLLDYWIIYSSLLVLFISDLKYQILPDSMIVIGSVGALGNMLLSPTASSHIAGQLLSAGGGFAILYLIWAATRGRGMGFGDVKFALFMGLFLGYPGIVVAFYTAFLTGALVGVILILAGTKGWKSKIAFGPFLILGTGVAYMWAPQIMSWWYRFL